MITQQTPAQPTTEHADQLVAEFVHLTEQHRAISAELDTINDRLDAIKGELRGLGAGAHQVGARTVTITPQRRFNPDTASVVLPAELLAQITTPTVSSAVAKRVLAPALYEACMAEVGAPRVVVK